MKGLEDINIYMDKGNLKHIDIDKILKRISYIEHPLGKRGVDEGHGGVVEVREQLESSAG